MYDDLDILAAVRTLPLAQSLWMVHGDAPIPLFRIFFSGMYALFSVNQLYWNLYFLLLVLAVCLTALAVLAALGANLTVCALFYLTTISAAVWNYDPTVGYYSMSIYSQIGLLCLVGIFAIICWRSGGSPLYKWLALATGIAAPFIHPSGSYVPVAVGAFAYLFEVARPGASWSPLRMLSPDFRWLTIGLVTGLIVFGAYFAIVVHDRPFLSMAHSPLSAEAVTKSAWFLFSQGVALELIRPFIRLFLRRTDLATQGMAAVTVALAFSIAGFRNVTTVQRRTYLALLAPSIIIIIVVSLGRRLTGIEDVVNSAGKYSTYAYLWFSLASFYLVSCMVPKMTVRWREASAVISILVAVVLFFQYARQDNIFRTEALRRGQQMDDLVAVFRNYAAKTTRPAHIPTLDGNFIYPVHAVLLYKYNLAHYRPFFQDFNDKLILLRNKAMDPWGWAGTQTVQSLREATDLAFVRALETDADLQSLYLDGVELEPRNTVRPDAQPMRIDKLKIENAGIVRSAANSLSFTTGGDAEIMLVPGDWDPEQAHILSMNINAFLEKPIPDEAPQIEVLFEGQLPIPYKPNKIAVPAGGGLVSVDLLQLYSFSLNPRVAKLRLRFARAGSYTIADVRLGRYPN